MGPDPLALQPEGWTIVKDDVEQSRHFLFYFRDDTFECFAEDWWIEPSLDNALFRQSPVTRQAADLRQSPPRLGRGRNHRRTVAVRRGSMKEVFPMMRGALLWLIGIPLPIILILWLLGYLS